MTQHEEQRAIEVREEYIATITASLRERLSAAEAFEQANEIRSHLDAMSTAFQELGEPEGLAMRKAIQRFGDAGRVGASIGRATTPRTGPLLPSGLVKLILLNMLICSLFAYVVSDLAYRVADRFFVVRISAGGWGPAPFLNILTLSLVASTVIWYAPKVHPARAGLIGIGIVSLHLPATLYFIRGAGIGGMLASLPYAYFTCVFAVCALSAYLAPKLQQAALPGERQPVA